MHHRSPLFTLAPHQPPLPQINQALWSCTFQTTSSSPRGSGPDRSSTRRDPTTPKPSISTTAKRGGRLPTTSRQTAGKQPTPTPRYSHIFLAGSTELVQTCSKDPEPHSCQSPPPSPPPASPTISSLSVQRSSFKNRGGGKKTCRCL